ncbi:MAG: response regulator [Rickettsiales bacterium]|nr:response regulator [Rickettsiales bacterium]
MIIIQSQVEKRFIETLEAVKEKPGNKRCLWLELSHLPEISRSALQEVVSEACRLFQNDDYQLFLLEQKGIIIVGNGITIEQMELFYHAVQTALDVTLVSKNITLYELWLQWGEVSVMAETLLQDKQANIQQRKQREVENQRQQILDLSFSPEEVQRMRDKRKLRIHTEVMVVEDDLFSRKLVCNALEKHHSTTVVENGYAALTTYVSAAPDIIFLDIDLPDISGHEICAKLMEIDPKAHIIMLSGNGDRENVMRAIEQGAKGFVGKPFSREKLLQHIQKCPTHKKSA